MSFGEGICKNRQPFVHILTKASKSIGVLAGCVELVREDNKGIPGCETIALFQL